MPPSPPLAMSPTLLLHSACPADLEMAVHGWSSTPERAIGGSLRPPEPGCSGGLTELEDGQLCSAVNCVIDLSSPKIAQHSVEILPSAP